MIISIKVRLEPNRKQASRLFQNAGTARFVYNWTLARQEDNFQNGGKFISDNDLRKELTQLKKTDELKWLGTVSNNVAEQAVKDGCDAYKTFFKKLSERNRIPTNENYHNPRISYDGIHWYISVGGLGIGTYRTDTGAHRHRPRIEGPRHMLQRNDIQKHQ